MQAMVVSNYMQFALSSSILEQVLSVLYIITVEQTILGETVLSSGTVSLHLLIFGTHTFVLYHGNVFSTNTQLCVN